MAIRLVFFCRIIVGLLILHATATHAASEAFCRTYAETAVQQYQEGIQSGAPGIYPPEWSNDYNGHYSWCLFVNEATANGETQKRDQFLAPYRARIPGQPPSPQVQPWDGQTGSINGSRLQPAEDCVDISRLTADASLANAVSKLTYIEAAIVTAGEGEQLVATLPLPIPKPGATPIPIPYPVANLAPTFQTVAQDLIVLRSHAFRNDTGAATRAKNAASMQAAQIVQYLSDQNANLPIPIPQPLDELMQIALKLQNQISLAPLQLPGTGPGATPIHIPVVRD